MEGLVAGNLVVVRWPFFDLSGGKRRPALILTPAVSVGRLDYLVCLITSKKSRDPLAIEITAADLSQGILDRRSFVRPLHIGTVDKDLIVKSIGSVTEDFRRRVTTVIIEHLNVG